MAAAFVAGDAVHTQGNRYLFFDIHSDRLRIAAASILNTFAGNFARKFYHKREIQLMMRDYPLAVFLLRKL